MSGTAWQPPKLRTALYRGEQTIKIKTHCPTAAETLLGVVLQCVFCALHTRTTLGAVLGTPTRQLTA